MIVLLSCYFFFVASSLFNGLLTLKGYLMPHLSLQNKCDAISAIVIEMRGFLPFLSV